MDASTDPSASLDTQDNNEDGSSVVSQVKAILERIWTKISSIKLF